MKVSRRLAVRLAILVAVVALLTPAVIFLRLWLAAPSAQCRAVPLMFHRIVPADAPAERYAMREPEFARQMEQLKAAGARTRPVLELVHAMEQAESSGACPFLPQEVVLTFDLDGASRDLETAVPTLRRLGLDAILFAPSGFVDHGRSVTSAELKAMADSGMTVGSHTQFHYDMRYEDPDSMVASLMRSRETLRAMTGQPILIASAPGGRYDDQVVRNLPRAGLEGFFNSDPCYIGPGSSRYRLCRVEIRGDGGMTAVQALHSPAMVARQATGWQVKRLVEAIVGRRLWGVIHSVGSPYE